MLANCNCAVVLLVVVAFLAHAVVVHVATGGIIADDALTDFAMHQLKMTLSMFLKHFACIHDSIMWVF